MRQRAEFWAANGASVSTLQRAFPDYRQIEPAAGRIHVPDRKHGTPEGPDGTDVEFARVLETIAIED